MKIIFGIYIVKTWWIKVISIQTNSYSSPLKWKRASIVMVKVSTKTIGSLV